MSAAPEKTSYRDTIATVAADGKRRWVYPKRPDGRFYRWRSWVSWGLLTVLFGLPFVKINGDPIVLLNVVARKFILFGLHFTPQDFFLFAVAMITAVVFISLFTAIFGRLFCGWVCPQTIFMEMVFRKVEYWIEGDANAQRRLNAAAWSPEKGLKKAGKHLIFLLISALIAHTFLAYVIGVDAVWNIVTQPPSRDWLGFLSILAFIGIFYFVFSYMREQVCIAICPYGRLQGVLLDNSSINVMYDWIRGEPRGKLRKQRGRRTKPRLESKSDCQTCPNCRNKGGGCKDDILRAMEDAALTFEAKNAPPAKRGDCIDCGLCVQVCPTGIDIRDGVQLECVNCTACIDACDAVMDKIGKPRGLIRYDSTTGIESGKRKLLTTRVKAYSVVLLMLIAANVALLSNRASVHALLLRTPGLLYQKNDDGSFNNLYTYQLVNKTTVDLPVEFRLKAGEAGTIRLVGDPPVARVGQVVEGALFIDRPATAVDGRQRIGIEIWSGGEKIDQFNTSFVGPPR